MAYYPAYPTPPQFTANGNQASGYVLKAYQADTLNPVNMYTDEAGGGGTTTLTLNAQGYPQVSGNIVNVWLDDSVEYKFALYLNSTDAATNSNAVWTIDDISRVLSMPVQVVEDVAAIQAGDFSLFLEINTRGYYTAGDGGAARYYLDSADTTSSDDGFMVIVDNAGNRFKLITDGIINILQAGAIGNDVNLNNTVFTQLEAHADSDFWVPDGNFKVSAMALTKTYRGPGTIKIDNVAQINDQDFVFVDPSSPRSVIQYRNATSVDIHEQHFAMGGFRFKGRYRKAKAPVFSSSNYIQTCSTASDLAFGMTSPTTENWYAVFMCAEPGDSEPTIQIVPFVRAYSVSGNVVTLNKGGEGIHSAQAQTFNWGANAVAGCDVLVISEQINGRAHAFSGRETTATANTSTTITLTLAGSMQALDWLLVAPKYTHYRYCGAFYYDTAEVRNICDTGTIVHSRGIYDLNGTNTGAVGSAELREISGYISPLATGVAILSTCNLATASGGQYVEYLNHDSSHTIHQFDYQKGAVAGHSIATPTYYCPFSFGQQYYFSNAGSLAASRTNGQQNIWGWIEP